MIILAAGQGTRLMPLTADRPKCMVEFQGRPIIEHILDCAARCGIDDIVCVCGYQKDKLKRSLARRTVTFRENKRFAETNMVASLFCAEVEMDDGLIISYADIVYSQSVLSTLIESRAGVGVVVDRKWRELWEMRMPNPLDDAETMKVDDQGHILELGKKAASYADVQGQYVGLIRISKSSLQTVLGFYRQLDRHTKYDGKDFENMYMTSFLQLIIDRLMPVQAVFIDGGWLEIDSTADLEAYASHNVRI